jgi:hypothetical protein
MARRTEVPPATASVVEPPTTYEWADQAWMQERAAGVHRPMRVYEVHLASWQSGRSYRDVAGVLADHLAHLGFTHVELLPVMEHPFGGSWGYQVTSYFAPTARWGPPDDLRALVARRFPARGHVPTMCVRFTPTLARPAMSPLRLNALSLAGLMAVATHSLHAQPAAPGSSPAPAATARQVITSAEQLPRRVVKLDKLPSQYLEAPRAEVQALAAALEQNLREDLAKFDIQDAATLRGYYSALLSLVQFRGDWAAVPALVERLKGLQDKPGPRATTGTMALILAEQQTGRRDAAWVQEEVRKRYGAMNWTDAGDGIKSFQGQMELLNPALVKGSFEQQVDVMARNMAMTVPEGLVGSIVGARLQSELIVPLKAAVVAGLQTVVDAQSRTQAAKPDVWTPRQFAIAHGLRRNDPCPCGSGQKYKKCCGGDEDPASSPA